MPSMCGYEVLRVRLAHCWVLSLPGGRLGKEGPLQPCWGLCLLSEGPKTVC